MKRGLLNLVTLMSLLLCVAVCALWLRSYFVADVVVWRSVTAAGGFRSVGGSIVCRRVVSARDGQPLPAEPFGEWSSFAYRTASPAEQIMRLEAKWEAPGFSVVDANVANVRIRGVAVAYWLLAALTAVAPAWRLGCFARLEHRRRPGVCAACGYDLRATPGRCPECGRPAGSA
jgi:hypothetical protein